MDFKVCSQITHKCFSLCLWTHSANISVRHLILVMDLTIKWHTLTGAVSTVFYCLWLKLMAESADFGHAVKPIFCMELSTYSSVQCMLWLRSNDCRLVLINIKLNRWVVFFLQFYRNATLNQRLSANQQPKWEANEPI